MRVKPQSGLRISIGADFDVCAGRLVVNEIPPLPAAAAVRRVFGLAIFLLINQFPFPG
jgi:hypothetical protein